MSKPFGEDLWRNVQAVRLDGDGTFHAPVRANGTDGIVVGTEAIAAADARPADPAPARPGLLRRLLRRR
ncbi:MULTISPECIES: hypothetical protein [unclassified Nocardioides]|uniref:hypothetical protein n=1 Tax=unclassified Nocardioides TaxID=2615069 RepID=UPI00301532F6